MSRETERLDRPIGVLALQGDFAAHGRAVAALGRPWVEIRRPEEISRVSGLILPGGESTTVSKFLSEDSFFDAILSASRDGMPVYGSCAGAILLAREIIGDSQRALGLIDVQIERNAYGRQVDSFMAGGPCPALGPPDIEMIFIRAPIVRKVGKGVEVLATWDDRPVFMRQGRAMITTFHPELSSDDRVHGLFVRSALDAQKVAGA